MAGVVELRCAIAQRCDSQVLQVRKHCAVELRRAVRFMDAEFGGDGVETQLDPLQQNRMIDRHRAFDGRNRAPLEATIRGYELELLAAVPFDRSMNLVEELEAAQRLAGCNFLRGPAIPLRGPGVEILHSLSIVPEADGQRGPLSAGSITALGEIRGFRRVVPFR